MGQLFSNNGSSTILGAIGAGDTVINVQPGDGERYPAIGATGDFFAGTLEDLAGNVEIVTVLSRTGDSMTVVRGAEGTSALPFADGSRFELRVTKETLENFAQKAGDAFTGVISVPGIDFLTSDGSTNPVFQQRYADESGVPVWSLTGPTTTPTGIAMRTYKAANEVWDWGIRSDGRQYGTGAMRHGWYESQSGDPAWYIDQTVTRPAPNQMRMEHRPEASALSTSYLFEVVDGAGVRREIILNDDGSITAEGDFQFGSLTLPYEQDNSAELLQVTFSQRSLFLAGPERIMAFEPNNIGGDAGNPSTGIGFLFGTRTADGTLGFFAIYPDGSVWSTGGGIFTQVTVGDQGAPDNVGPNELTTKSTVQQLIDGGGSGGGSGYFAEVLWEQIGGAASGSFALDNPLITLTPSQITHYQQVIIECIPDTGDYSTITLDTNTMRLNSRYVLGSPYNADSLGGAGLEFTDYQNFTVSNPNGGRISRIIGVSFQGDPFP